MNISHLNPTNFELFSHPKAALILKEFYYLYQPFSAGLFNEYLNKGILKKEIHEHQIAIKKVIITPTSYTFYPPEIEISNRVMR